MLSKSEVMKILGVSKLTLLKWTNSNPPKIKGKKVKFGKKDYWVYSPAEVKRVKEKMKDFKPGIGWF